jgi:dimethylaniline monooxygenase (N-oxide forming)
MLRPEAAPDPFARDATAFGAITSNEMTERERRYWSLVTTAGR